MVITDKSLHHSFISNLGSRNHNCSLVWGWLGVCWDIFLAKLMKAEMEEILQKRRNISSEVPCAVPSCTRPGTFALQCSRVQGSCQFMLKLPLQSTESFLIPSEPPQTWNVSVSHSHSTSQQCLHGIRLTSSALEILFFWTVRKIYVKHFIKTCVFMVMH